MIDLTKEPEMTDMEALEAIERMAADHRKGAVKTLEQMTDMEALEAIERMAADHRAYLKEAGETLQDFYSPVEDWIPRLAKIIRTGFGDLKLYCIRAQELTHGDYIIVRAPLDVVEQYAENVSKVFRRHGIRVIGCPDTVTLDVVSAPPEGTNGERPQAN